MTRAKLAIYTAIYGDTDILIEPQIIPKQCDFFCFTDRTDISSNIYKIIHTPAKFPNDPNRSAKFFKIYPHEFFKDYEYSLWMDARTYVIDPNIFQVTKQLLKSHDLAIFKHPQRTSIFEEAQICIDWNKDSPEVINKQIAKYQKEAYKETHGLAMATFLFRRHHSNDLINFEKAWWAEILEHSKRDQISFPYCVWKTKYKFKRINQDIYNNDLLKIISYKEREKLKQIKGSHNKNKIVVYTALLSNYHQFTPPLEKNLNFDYVLFTDNPQIEIDTGDVKYVDLQGRSPHNATVMFKILSHHFLPEYKYAVWLDPDIEITTKNLIDLILEALSKNQIGLFRHHVHRSLETEITFLKRSGIYNSNILGKQYQIYLKQGFQDVDLFGTSAIIRNNHNPKIIRFNKLWWRHFQIFLSSENISLPYVVWKTELHPFLIPGNISKNSFFKQQLNTYNSNTTVATNKNLKILYNYIKYLIWYAQYKIRIPNSINT